MKIKYLGTAAAEGIPALCCSCDTCKRSKKLGGKNLRTRSQAIIDDTLLIDFNLDTYSHVIKYNIDLTKINNVLITHSHWDHLLVPELECFSPGYSYGRKESINFYSASSGYEMIKSEADKSYMAGSVKYHLLEPFREYFIQGYKVSVIPANHSQDTTPVVFLLEKNGKRLLYAHDTGWLETNAIDFIGRRIDFISVDCTGGINKNWRDEHLCLDTAIEFLEHFKQKGIVDEKTVKVINHFSHNGKATNNDFIKRLKGTDIICSYDGLEIEI